MIDLHDNQKRTSNTLLRAALEGATEALGGSCRCGQSHLRVMDLSGGLSDEAVTAACKEGHPATKVTDLFSTVLWFFC